MLIAVGPTTASETVSLAAGSIGYVPVSIPEPSEPWVWSLVDRLGPLRLHDGGNSDRSEISHVATDSTDGNVTTIRPLVANNTSGAREYQISVVQ